MTDNNPSCISHVSLGTNDYRRAKHFYETVLATIGCKLIMEHPEAAAFGKSFPEFWICAPHDGKPATIGNGVHVGFMANSKAEVDAFYQAAIAHHAAPDGKPGPRPEYGEPFYGCFVRDPDGNKIEAAFWDMELAAKLGQG
ncbi:VOC family protein [Aestuariivirga sp.]|uniref:VOC family protein n=1 Tax=Aestuariivirga sp. TaxID=2650926 RepID=UPI003593A448